MFTPGKLYKHINSKDIYYRVGAIAPEGDKIRMLVKYWNHFYGIFQGHPEWVYIDKKDLDKWSEVK